MSDERRIKRRDELTEQDVRDAKKTSGRMFTEPEVVELLMANFGLGEEHARETINDHIAHLRGTGHTIGTLQYEGASAVEGVTLVEVDDGLEVLLPRATADAIYAVAEHFNVKPKVFMAELVANARKNA